MHIVKFTVDSALLRELGERLVGKPYIALAELVKNGYDADAHEVSITIDSIEKHLLVVDDGQGMTEDEFKNFWMRVGSTHKEKLRYSRKLKRLMTGSKGVGRLAVQFLAGSLTLETTSEYDLNKRLIANITWEKAVNAGDLTQATVEYDILSSTSGFDQGTSIKLTNLKHQWAIDEIKGLASELWWLQPPFRKVANAVDDYEKRFDIEFLSPFPAFEKAFKKGMRAILGIWEAKIVGKNSEGEVNFSLEFAGEDPVSYKLSIPNCKLQDGEWEIRIYNLRHRQPNKIKVDQAREYFNEFGGVHVYDGGFHLPYYGDPLNDWLGIEIDHSHRLTLSKLLPKNLQVEDGLMFLPTNSRIFGEVKVNTSIEKNLKISITRDRLQASEALSNLQFMIRYCLDLYAMEEKRRNVGAREIRQEIQSPRREDFEDIIRKYEKEIPEEVLQGFKKDVEYITEKIKIHAEDTAKQVSIVGPLATAGISSLAYQHELGKQFVLIEDIILQLKRIKVPSAELQTSLDKLVRDLSIWVNRARATNSLFSYFGNAEDTQLKERFRAKTIVKDVENQLHALAGETIFDLAELNDDLLLPKATLIEWGAVFQNIFINAFNAVLKSEKKIVKVSSRTKWNDREILVQDTGTGVDLDEAELLFQPFVRRMNIPQERQAQGYGGMGLGLTIVRLIANNLGCSVRFIDPEKGFRTALSIKWSELE